MYLLVILVKVMEGIGFAEFKTSFFYLLCLSLKLFLAFLMILLVTRNLIFLFRMICCWFLLRLSCDRCEPSLALLQQKRLFLKRGFWSQISVVRQAWLWRFFFGFLSEERIELMKQNNNKKCTVFFNTPILFGFLQLTFKRDCVKCVPDLVLDDSKSKRWVEDQ